MHPLELVLQEMNEKFEDSHVYTKAEIHERKLFEKWSNEALMVMLSYVEASEFWFPEAPEKRVPMDADVNHVLRLALQAEMESRV